MAILDVHSLNRPHLVREAVAWHLQAEPTISAFEAHDSCQTPRSSRGNTEDRSFWTAFRLHDQIKCDGWMTFLDSL